MELFKASHQWATRPNDERFETIQDLYNQTKQYADLAKEKHEVPYTTLRADVVGRDITLVGKGDVPTKMTHWAFGQLATKIQAPADYLRSLPPTLAVQNINHGLKDLGDQKKTASLMMHQNGELVLRSITSDKYTRFWNYQVAEKLLKVEKDGWKTPPAMPVRNDPRARKATEKDVQRLAKNGWGIKVGDMIAPAGIYASDHDMFVFLVNEDRRIKDGSPEGLGRGVFVTNSEVGDGGCNFTTFLYRFICGNHIVWGAKNVKSYKVRHIGNLVQHNVSKALYDAMTAYEDESAKEEEQLIQAARNLKIGDSKQDVTEKLFSRRTIGLSKKVIELAYDSTIPDIDGSPLTVWGFVNGLTRASQLTPYGDIRMAMESAAQPIMALAK